MNYHLANFHHFNHLIISAHQIHGHCIWIWFIQWKKPGKKKSVSHSILSDSFTTPWTVTRQAPLSKGFSRQEYWSRLPFPTPGDLPNPGIKLHLLHWQVDSLPLSHQGNPYTWYDAAKNVHYLCALPISTDSSPPGSSVQGIFQARILEWAAISYSRGSSWPRDWTPVSWDRKSVV